MTPDEFDLRHRAVLGNGRNQLMARFGGDPNVTGFGVGVRTRGGEVTDEPVVVAMVAKKRQPGYVARNRILPETVDIDGRRYGVDVIEAGPFTMGNPIQPQAAGPITRKMRPAKQGCSIANINGFGIGTLGCMVRDRTDDTVGILSCNHVIANLNFGKPGEVIVQPGDALPWDPANGIAKLKRFVPLVPVSQNPNYVNTVDGGFAQATSDSVLSKGIAEGLMPPISSEHPAIGVLFAGDQQGNCLIADMRATLDALGVDLLAPNAVATARLRTHADKVGRTTAYTATEVIALDVVVGVIAEIAGKLSETYLMKGHLVSVFGLAGDSGSVVCRGGDGGQPANVDICIRFECRSTTTAMNFYKVPVRVEDADLSDRVRDEFFMQSRVGRLLTQVYYLNEHRLDRVAGMEATPDEQFFADLYYSSYRETMAVLGDPSHPDHVFTDFEIADLGQVVFGLGLHMNDAEAAAMDSLYNQVAVNLQGKNRQQAIAYLNDPAVYNKVHDTIRAVPGVVVYGAL